MNIRAFSVSPNSLNSFIIVVGWWPWKWIESNNYLGTRLDYFIVGVTNVSSAVSAPVRGAYPLCGQYPSSTANATRLEIICIQATPPGRFVIIQQPATGAGQLTVCELEVYRKCWLRFSRDLPLPEMWRNSFRVGSDDIRLRTRRVSVVLWLTISPPRWETPGSIPTSTKKIHDIYGAIWGMILCLAAICAACWFACMVVPEPIV